MSVKKTNQKTKTRIPELKTPDTKKLTVQETTGEVLTAIRQHEPADQNAIIETIIAEIGIDRVNKEQSTSTAFSNAQQHSGKFFNMVNGKIVDEKMKDKASNNVR
jgi:hypothetical protein